MLPVLLAVLACDSEPAEAPAVPAAPVAPAPAPDASQSAKSATAVPEPSGTQKWEQLRAERAEATSFLKSNWNKYNENYHPSYVLDGNPKTAWVEGVDGNGEHESLTIPLSPLGSARAVKLRIRNGYQKSDTLFVANAVPRKVKITAWSSARTTSSEVELPREVGWQEVELSLPAGFGLNAVSLELLSVYPGSKYQDTCISDIEVFVDSEVPYNAAQEEARHKKLMAWVSERVETAKFFAARPASYPFASAQLTSSRQEATDAEVVPAMVGPREALAQMKDAEGWQVLSASRSIPALPDGIYDLSSGVLPLFMPDALSFVATDEATGFSERDADTFEEEGEVIEMWSSELVRSNHKVLMSGSSPKLIYFWEKRVEHGRGTYEDRTDYLASYSAAGELEWVYRVSEGSSELGPERWEALYSFVRTGGQISVVEEKSIGDVGEQDWKEHLVYVTRYSGA